MRHGHRGAAEIAQTVDNVFAYAALAGLINSHQFDLLFDATIGDDSVRAFLIAANAQAAQAIAARFEEAMRRGLWATRRNTTAAIIASLRPIR
jgi:cobaltochelatase CobN